MSLSNTPRGRSNLQPRMPGVANSLSIQPCEDCEDQCDGNNQRDWTVNVRARILQASTSEVYGDPLIHPQTEDYWGNVNPIGTRSCYDEGKRIAETLMMDYHRQNNHVDMSMIFNTYGPRMLENDGRVVSNFVVQALRGQPLTLYGEGEQTRSFCYVDDLVNALIKLMNSEDFHEPVNLGNRSSSLFVSLPVK